jgi:hypothetical protein
MNIKYTSDGKKVIVVGKLNTEETIVQEVFVSESGQEIPSGENFVTKSLHDEPVLSWKEKRLDEIERNYERRKRSMEDDLDRAKRQLKIATEKAKQRASALFAFANNSKEEGLDRLKAFLSGEIKYLAFTKYKLGIFEISDNDFYQTDSRYGDMKIEGIKLVSLFGNSSGDLSFRINRYRDGSGDWQEIYPFKTREEALTFMQEECDKESEKYLSGDKQSFRLDSWEKIEGIVVPIGAKEKIKAERRKKAKDRISTLIKEISKLKTDNGISELILEMPKAE